MEELKTLNTTILIIEKGDKILLGRKKRGFANGKLIGIGGKQDKGESIEQTMIRETQEEIGLTPTNYKQVGLILFNTYYKGEHVNLVLNIFTANEFEGKEQETDEILPMWFARNNIPYNEMLEDDILWMEIVLGGKLVMGEVKFDPNLKMLHNTICECSEQQLQNYIKNNAFFSDISK